MIKNQLVDKWFRRNRLYFVNKRTFDYIVDKIKIDYSHRELLMRVKKDNSNILYIETVKQGCDI
jgi:hypothetical protein